MTDALHEARDIGVERDADTPFWLAISRVPHIGPARIERLLSRFGSLRVAWAASRGDLRAVLDARPLAELVEARGRVDPLKELERIEARGIRVLHPAHPSYPRLLAEAPGRPSVLYCRGEIAAPDDVAVGIVGTRGASPYGREVTGSIAAGLAQAGVTVVSGLARGVDAVAHAAALSAGGRTIAVLGSGVDVIYPSEHRVLAQRIVEAGAVVSEQPPDAKPDAQNFPARNRIISGLSLGVVVVEAPARSGALITATFAADQGRDVFVVPGSVLASNSEGSNALLRDGARLVRGSEDILEDLNLGSKSTALAVQSQLALDEHERALYRAIQEEPKHIDELAESTGQAAQKVSATLMTMELRGLVRNLGAQFYVKR